MLCSFLFLGTDLITSYHAVCLASFFLFFSLSSFPLSLLFLSLSLSSLCFVSRLAGTRCTNLRLLNVAACSLTTSLVAQWLDTPWSLPEHLYAINISCNPGLRAGLRHTMVRIVTSMPSLRYLTYVACHKRVIPLRVERFMARVRNSLKQTKSQNTSSSTTSSTSISSTTTTSTSTSTSSSVPHFTSPDEAPFNHVR